MKYAYSCLIAVIALSSVSTFTQAKTIRTDVYRKLFDVEVQCDDLRWTGLGLSAVSWGIYCSKLSARQNGNIIDSIKVKADCDDATPVVQYKMTDDEPQKFKFLRCENLMRNETPYSQSR